MARPVWSFEAQADDAEEQYRRLRQNVKTCEEEKNVFFFFRRSEDKWSIAKTLEHFLKTEKANTTVAKWDKIKWMKLSCPI